MLKAVLLKPSMEEQRYHSYLRVVIPVVKYRQFYMHFWLNFSVTC